MKRILPLLILFISVSTFAQQELYHKVKVYANFAQLKQMADAGIPVDHGKKKQDTYIITDYSESEIATISSLGITYDILWEDMETFYRTRNENATAHSENKAHNFGNAHVKRNTRATCGGGSSGGAGVSYSTPSNFNLGSVAGFYNYAEFLQELDDMVTQYPNIITTKAPIGPNGSPYTTHDGNNVYWLKISDNPNTNEAEPEIMYSAIHHAREPASLSEVIFYMWYLLENYGTDPEVTYLVDHTEMYFVPMINPDGYDYNMTNSPGGGGMWRKNRRNNGGGDYGVDLNRNYSYQFGASGVSTNPGADNYLGPNAFSEPETQAMKYFHEENEFSMALNAHTYGNYLLHPFGYDYVQTADHNIFGAYSGIMVEQNGFVNMLSANLYPAAGDSDDWGYDGDLATKPKVMSMTPEVGSDSHGFWPLSSEITSICEGTVYMNLHGAHIVGVFGRVTDTEPTIVENLTGHFNFDLTRYGMTQGPLTVTITPYGAGINSVGPAKTYTTMNVLDVVSDSIQFTLDPTIMLGQTFEYVISVSNGNYTWNDTVSKIYGNGTVIYADNGNSMADWTSSSWNTTAAEYYSPSASITDSPFGNYQNNQSNYITLNQTIDLTNAVVANMTFFGKWEIEDGYDYCQLQASTDGNSWSPLCGRYTNLGTADQDNGEHLWDGFQTSWVQEQIDLSDYLGQSIELRFLMESDGGVREDGFYFDDVEITVIETVDTSTTDTTNTGANINDYALNVELIQNVPNPAANYTTIQHDLKSNTNAELIIVNSVGKLIEKRTIQSGQRKTVLNTQSYADGIYFYFIESEGKRSITKRMTIVK